MVYKRKHNLKFFNYYENVKPDGHAMTFNCKYYKNGHYNTYVQSN